MLNRESKIAVRQKAIYRKPLTMHKSGRANALHLRKSAKSVDTIFQRPEQSRLTSIRRPNDAKKASLRRLFRLLCSEAT